MGGVLGGILNCLIIEREFLYPRIKEDEQGRSWEPGFLSPIFVGGVAGVVIYLLDLTPPPFGKQFAMSVLAGLGGGSILISLMEKHQISIWQRKTKKLGEAITSILPEEKENE